MRGQIIRPSQNILSSASVPVLLSRDFCTQKQSKASVFNTVLTGTQTAHNTLLTFLASNTQKLLPSSSMWFHQRSPTSRRPVTFWKQAWAIKLSQEKEVSKAIGKELNYPTYSNFLPSQTKSQKTAGLWSGRNTMQSSCWSTHTANRRQWQPLGRTGGKRRPRGVWNCRDCKWEARHGSRSFSKRYVWTCVETWSDAVQSEWVNLWDSLRIKRYKNMKYNLYSQFSLEGTYEQEVPEHCSTTLSI